MFGPILQSKNVFIIHKDAMERVATSEEQAGAGQAGQGKHRVAASGEQAGQRGAKSEEQVGAAQAESGNLRANRA